MQVAQRTSGRRFKKLQEVNTVKKIGPVKGDNKEIIMDDNLKVESLNM